MCGLTYYILKYIIIISGVIINRYSKELDMTRSIIWSTNEVIIIVISGFYQEACKAKRQSATLAQHWNNIGFDAGLGDWQHSYIKYKLYCYFPL